MLITWVIINGFGIICYVLYLRIYGVVVAMLDFYRSDQGSNPGRGDEIS